VNQLAIVENPSSGERIVFKERASNTDTQLLQFEWSVHPLGPLPDRVKRYPGHAHPIAEERIRVLAGRLWVRADGEERTLTTGQEILIPPKTSHSWWNVGSEEVSAIVEFRPAGRMESLFEVLFGMAQGPKLGGFKTLLRYAVICHDFRDDISILAASERWGCFFFWPLGKLLGYKSEKPRAKASKKVSQ